MRYYKATGFVLGRRNLGEADRIVTVYTREHGLLRVVAKGVRRSQAKLAGHLEPFTQVALRLTKGRNLDIIIGAQAIDTFDSHKTTHSAIGMMYFITEITSRLSAENQPNEVAYHLLNQCSDKLKGGSNPRLVAQYFSLRFLQTLGSQPDITAAEPSGNNYLAYNSGKIQSFRPAEHYGIIGRDTIKLWRVIYTQELAMVLRLTNIDDSLIESEKLLTRYYEYHFNFLPKSIKVFVDQQE